MLVLVDAPGDARLQAAALACCLIAGNLAALCAATVASGPPPEWDPEPSSARLCPVSLDRRMRAAHSR